MVHWFSVVIAGLFLAYLIFLYGFGSGLRAMSPIGSPLSQRGMFFRFVSLIGLVPMVLLYSFLCGITRDWPSLLALALLSSLGVPAAPVGILLLIRRARRLRDVY